MRTRKSKSIWKSMFFSYILIIIVSFTLFSGLMLAEIIITTRQQTARENQLRAQEVASVITDRVMQAQSIAGSINASSTVSKLFLSIQNNQTLDTVSLRALSNELAQLHAASARKDLEAVVLLADSYNKGYSSTGVFSLNEPYTYVSGHSGVTVDTISNALGFDANGKLALVTNGFLYIADYSYSSGPFTGSSRGSIAVLFNLDVLYSDIAKVLGDNASFSLVVDNEIVLAAGQAQGSVYSYSVSSLPGEASVEVYYQEGIFTAVPGMLVAIVLGGLAVAIAFTVLAYYFARKYYEPFEHISRLVPDVNHPTHNGELDSILFRIRNLIGERNGYREQMLTITPYAQEALWQGMLAGNVGKEAVQRLAGKSFLDVQKPFFIIAAVNFATKNDTKEVKAQLRKAVDALGKIYTKGDIGVYTFAKDAYNYFIIVNSSSDDPQDDLFFAMHKTLTQAAADASSLVTMGVDEVQNDIEFLQTACLHALVALEELTISGRGELYFYEPSAADTAGDYYFPQNGDLKLIKYVRAGQTDEIKQLLDEVYLKNINNAGLTAASAFMLADEVYMAVLKCVKDVGMPQAAAIRVEKPRPFTTLAEIFDYYYSILDALIQQAAPPVQAKGEDASLGAVILQYVEDNFDQPEMSLQYLTGKFQVSSKYISQLYKNRMGTTYLQNLQAKRINKATDLLKTGNYTLEQVSEMCGYTNLLTFRRNFKSYTGVNPSEYKNM